MVSGESCRALASCATTASAARPLARTREYVDVVRQVLRREAPVTLDGAFYQLPLTAERGGSGLGKALRSTVHPLRADLPIHLAAEGPKNIALAAEITDGWLPLFYAPRLDEEFRALLDDGFARRSPALSAPADFEVSATVPVVVGDDAERAADTIRPFLALYIGGMGAKGANFHRNAVDRLGYGEVCDEVQAHFLAGAKDRAAAAIPLELVDDVALVGPAEKISRGLAEWSATAVTTLIVQGDPRTLATLASLVPER